MLKKSGILLAVLALSTFTLASSASAQTAQAPAAAVQAVQAVTPLPAFLTAPAVETPAVAPANGTTRLEWLDSSTNNLCTCSKNSQCASSSGYCCWWAHQKCGICCTP
jgi:hypothetical protein